MVRSDIGQLQRSSAQRDGSLTVDGFVRYDGVRLLQGLQALLRPSVRDDSRTSLLECLPSGDVIEVMVAVDQIANRLVGDLANFGQVLCAALRAAVPDGV